MSMPAPDTPELNKQHKIIERGDADLIQRFYDWLRAKDYVVAELVECKEPDFDGTYTRWLPIRMHPESLMADFFGIDLKKIDEERRAVLEVIRSTQ